MPVFLSVCLAFFSNYLSMYSEPEIQRLTLLKPKQLEKQRSPQSRCLIGEIVPGCANISITKYMTIYDVKLSWRFSVIVGQRV